MNTNRFAQTWSNRFCARKKINPARAQQWHHDLISAYDGPWMRVIANQWLNRKFESKRDVESAMLWLGQNKTGLFFCTPRGNSNLEYGLQFWLTHADDVFLVHMMAAPVVQIRTFTAEQFAAHLTTMLAWQTQS